VGAGDIRQELSEGLEGDEREARLALVDHLLGMGCSTDELRDAHATGRLTLLPLELVVADEGDQTMAEVADAHRVDLDELERTRRALGLPADREAAVYGEALNEHAARLRAALDAGVPVEALVEVNRVIGRSMAAIVAAGRDVIARTLGPGADLDEHQQATRVAAAVEQLMPMMRDVLDYAYDEHSRELVRKEQAGALALAAGDPNVRDIAVAFADLVGYTSLGDALGPGEAGAVAMRLEHLAGEALRPPTTLIKTIGDEVMLASPDASALAESVIGLLAAADGADGLPALRAGAAAGPAVSRAADWYGAPVNLASRLTALAEPGTLLADRAFRDAAGDTAAWSDAGDRQVRGVAEPVATYALSASR
jgi:adenylate cyclase